MHAGLAHTPTFIQTARSAVHGWVCAGPRNQKKGQNFPTTRDILTFYRYVSNLSYFHVLLKKETKPQDLGVVAHTRKVIFHFFKLCSKFNH